MPCHSIFSGHWWDAAEGLFRGVRELKCKTRVVTEPRLGIFNRYLTTGSKMVDQACAINQYLGALSSSVNKYLEPFFLTLISCFLILHTAVTQVILERKSLAKPPIRPRQGSRRPNDVTDSAPAPRYCGPLCHLFIFHSLQG